MGCAGKGAVTGRKIALALLACVALAACETVASGPSAGKPIFRAASRGAGYQKAAWYAPKGPVQYVETGLAGWHADPRRQGRVGRWFARTFHRKAKPAVGTVELTALTGLKSAMPTPAIAEVTNVSTGATIRVRVEARAELRGRVISLTEDGVRQLGGDTRVPMKVRVRYAAPMVVMREAKPLRYALSKPKAKSKGAPAATQLAAASLATPPAPAAVAPAAPSAPVQLAAVAAPPARSAQSSGQAAAARTDAFRLQVGAFASVENARRAADRLIVMGGASIEPMQRDGAVLYRVLVRAPADPERAREVQARVAALGFAQARLLPL